jgi:predicted NBD/HSP70 family sugar kinase
MVGIQTGATPAKLRRLNERTLVGLLMRLGSASRADLAKAASLSQPTAGKITNELLDCGILEEADEPGNGSIPAQSDAAPRLGRPGKLLRLNGGRPGFIGIQLGVTETSLAALPLAVQERDCWQSVFPTRASPEAWVRRLGKAAGRLDADRVLGVLVSVPGIVDERAGSVIFSPNLHWTEKANLARLVRRIWKTPVVLVQEIRALALGHLVANPSETNFLLVDFEQGVGGAIVQDGRLYDHPLPLNGELGHTPVIGNPRVCGCGAAGCVETLVSQRGLLKSFEESGVPGPHDWPALVRFIARHGLVPWLASSINAVGAVIAGALNVLGLRRVILTGCLTDLAPAVLEQLADAIKRGAMWGRFGEVTCQAAPRRRAAGLAAAGLDRILLPLEDPSSLLDLRPIRPASYPRVLESGKL